MRIFNVYDRNMTRTGPLGCTAVNECLNKSTWADLSTCLNTDAHGRVHDLVGGAKKLNVHSFSHADIQKSGVTALENFLHLSNFLSKKLWRMGYLQCPSSCSTDTPQADCQCKCDLADGREPSAILADSGIFEVLAKQDDTNLFFGEADGKYHIKGKTEVEELRDFAGLLDNLCDIGIIGDMFSGSSPADITFWVVHPNIDRLLRLKLLSNTLTDMTWGDYDECPQQKADYVSPDFGRDIFFDPDGQQSG